MSEAKTLRSMPEDVRALRDTWESRADRITGLTWELEQDFRFGQRITRTDTGFVMGGTLKGGSSSMWYPASKDQYKAFKRWQGIEGVYEARDDLAFENLSGLLAKHGVELVTRRSSAAHARRRKTDETPFAGYGPLYADMYAILSQLPAEHLSRSSLERIQLGGWGPDAAKASAYKDGAVMMYDFACRGARRTFLGLFLHELGHAHEVDLSEEIKDRIHKDYHAVLVEDDAFFGIEFLVDADTRKLYQKFVFNEFLAETYMIYTACGEGMRREIEKLPDRAREAWERIYAVFRDTFHGIEYA